MNFKQWFNIFLIISEAWQGYESKAYGVSNYHLNLQSENVSRSRDIHNFPTQGWADTAFYMRNWSETYVPLNFRTMRKLSDLYSGIFQNSLTCAKWNFPLNFRSMRKLSDLYSGIFQTQSSGCASGVDLFRNFTKLKILNIWIVKYLLNCKRYLSYNFQIFQKISECWVLENLDVHLEWTTSELEFWNFQHAFLQFSEHTEISTCFFTVFRTYWKFQHAFL